MTADEMVPTSLGTARLAVKRRALESSENLGHTRTADPYLPRELGPIRDFARVEHSAPFPGAFLWVWPYSSGPTLLNRPSEIHQKCRKQVPT